MKYLLKGARLIDPQVDLDELTDLLIADGRIAAIGEIPEVGDAQLLDLSGKILVPGLIDIHVHLREPGFEQKEDIESGTRAAIHGGITAVCSMPNTNPETDTAEVVDYVRARAEEVNQCRVYPSAACTLGRKGEALTEMGELVDHGVVAFTDDGRGVQNAGVMRRVMDYGKMFNRVIMSHCQDEGLVGGGQVNEGLASTRLGLAGWPAAGEEIQIARDILLGELTGCPIHIQHLSSAAALDIVRAAKERGNKVSCEVTPNHLFLTEDAITESYETQFKINPPLRTESDRQALIGGLVDGTIDCIVTDHAPHADFEKEREFELAPFGMTGLETSLGAVLSYLVRPGIIDYQRMVELMSVRPREIIGVPAVRLEEAAVADLTIFDPELKWTVTTEAMESKAHNSGFIGAEFTGKATEVFVNGVLKMQEARLCD